MYAYKSRLGGFRTSNYGLGRRRSILRAMRKL